MVRTVVQKANIGALEYLGLSENESVLYQLMLQYSRSTVQELNLHSPFPRTLLYYVLKQLVRRGLVSEQKTKRRTIYTAENPQKLYELLTQKNRVVEREHALIRNLIPQLKHQYQLAGKRPVVRAFDGSLEYEKALEDCIVTSPKEIYSYERLGTVRPALETREIFDKKRIARKIPKKVLFFDTEAAMTELKKRKYDDFTQFRSFTSAIGKFDTDMLLFGGKVLYTSSTDEREPSAILIEDNGLYEMQKSLFLVLWKEGRDRTLAFTEKV